MKKFVYTFLLLGIVLWVSAQSPTTTAPRSVPAPPLAGSSPQRFGDLPPGQYMGPATCAASSCHGSPAPLENTGILQNEYDSWLHAGSPSHVKAYEVLLNATSRRIMRNMGIRTPAERTKLCLDCHSTNVPTSLQSNPIELTDGVSCEACHGPASGWIAQHVQRDWSHEQSVEAGMTDVRSVPTRARLCMSCHLGDSTKSVDHFLIAAGHPLLRFELDNYTESPLMPPHWKPHGERPYAATERNTHGVRAWAVGQAVAFGESMNQLARVAGSNTWPEFSVLSCDTCHHTLREGAWRQERGYDGPPGLPHWSSSQWIVLRAILGEVAPGELATMDREVAALARTTARMTDEAAIASNARSLGSRVGRLVPRIDELTWNERRIRSMISRAATPPSGQLTDRRSAEQVTYALVSLSSQLVQENPRLVRSDLVRNIDALYAQLNAPSFPDEFNRDRFVATLARLR